jgi:hypothetical protein
MAWAGRTDLKDFEILWQDDRGRLGPVMCHIPTGIQLWEVRESAQYDADR